MDATLGEVEAQGFFEEPDEDYQECAHCEGKGWGFDFNGGRIVCPECGGKGDNDPDPECHCGVCRSEHRMMGCPEGFQTKGAWESERDWIVTMDEDTYERVSEAMGW